MIFDVKTLMELSNINLERGEVAKAADFATIAMAVMMAEKREQEMFPPIDFGNY
jgi:hypothetical protein